MSNPSYDDLYNLGFIELLTIHPELSVKDGDVSDAYLSAAAAMADKAVQVSIEGLRKTFISTAEGDDLTNLVFDHYNILRKSATFAVGVVEFTRTGAATAAGTIPIGTKVGTAFNENSVRIEAETQDEVSYLAGETGVKSATVVVTVTGTDGNILAGEITGAIDVLFDSNIAVGNTTNFSGGGIAESDEDLRDRAISFPSTLRRGTLAALEFGALSVSGVATATASEDPVSSIVTVTVADQNGGSNAQLIQSVDTELINWRAAGVAVNVVGVNLVSIAISITITAKKGFDLDANKTLIQDAITSAVGGLKAGESLYSTLIECAAVSVDPTNIQSVTVVSPSSTVVAATNDLIRASVITVN